jgi:hypothetical protein
MPETIKIVQMNDRPIPGLHYQEVTMEMILHHLLRPQVTKMTRRQAVVKNGPTAKTAVNDGRTETESHLNGGNAVDTIRHRPVMMTGTVIVRGAELRDKEVVTTMSQATKEDLDGPNTFVTSTGNITG